MWSGGDKSDHWVSVSCVFMRLLYNSPCGRPLEEGVRHERQCVFHPSHRPCLCLRRQTANWRSFTISPFLFSTLSPPTSHNPCLSFPSPPPIQGHSSTIVLNPYSVSKASFKSVHRDSVNIYCIKWLHSKVNEGESVQICMTDTNLCTYVTETYLYME